MAIISLEKLEALSARFAAIEDEMSSVTESDDIVRLSKEHAELKPVVEAAQELITARGSIDDLEEMAKSEDKEMAIMAQEELRDIKDRLPELEKELQIMLLPKDKADSSNVVLEIRAGTGGDEAAIFAGDLFRMYQRYASIQGWKVEIMSSADADMGGYKEIQASISGNNIFAKMKFESGVHRVQRVPETETQGRVHTSAATVAVLPEAEDIDIEIRNEDIRIDTMRASGAGGQHVNTTDSAVRITHMPSGIVVTSSVKSQHQNRAFAMTALRAKLYDMERQKLDEERAADRKGQIGSGDRSERIRTYNYPQSRVTDHRINLTSHNLGKIIAGDALDELIDALIAQDQADRLAAMEGE